MSIAASLIPRPRVVVLCLASLLLHTLAIRWVGAHIDPPKPPAAKPPATTIVAQLRTAAEPREAIAVAKPKPLPKPAPPVRKPVPKVEEPQEVAAEAPAPTAEASASVGDAPDQASARPAAGAKTPAALPADAAAQAPATPDPVEATPAQVAPVAGPRKFKASLPPSAELVLEVRRKDADGSLWNGAGAIIWQNAGSSYKIAIEAGISMIVTRVNLLVLTSEGTLGEAGIAPVLSTEKRRGRSQTATHFNQQEGRITFSSSDRAYPLIPGTQDKASLPLQLAGIGRADPGQLSGDIEIMVGEDREANMFRFIVVGQEELETKLGKLTTWHLSRPPRPGSYNSKLEVWLAPERDWYPVQIRNTEASGAITTQVVTKIVTPRE
jgi:hypothetical protein